jgi:crotonobetainyl-CoA:carnitine CoA-transferase CaiB-like acyl-CoA transferase
MRLHHETAAPCESGHLSAFAILVALFHRLRTGEGQHVQASLSGTGTYLQIPFMVDFAGRRWDEPSGLVATGGGPLYRLYKGSDRWFFLATQQLGQLSRLATIEGLHGVDQASAIELPALLETRFAAASAGAWVTCLTAAGLSAQVARDVHENMADPVHIARGLSMPARPSRTRPDLQCRALAPVLAHPGRSTVRSAADRLRQLRDRR